MSKSYVLESGYDFYPELEENVMDSIFKQYERVIIESLITSFGLDFIVKDRYGGDVDTIHNVRKIGKDKEMTYKNKQNETDYEYRGKYDSHAYHSHKGYKEKNKQISMQKKDGTLKDAYTGESIGYNGKSDLDHVIAAKEIHDDAGRVLAGLSGVDLANSNENLEATNPHTNRTKKADSMNDFLDKYGDEYTEFQKDKMREKDAIARKSYEAKLAKAYYTSPKFAKDVAFSAGNVGVRMGLRQVLGFVFTEVWFTVKEEFDKLDGSFDFAELLNSIGNGIKRGFENAKEKYKELLAKFTDGVVVGALSSISTTMCNIFFTTAKNVVKTIRQTYASLVQAGKVLFINPDSLEFGERMRAIVKILATGASIVFGTTVSEAIGKTPIGTMPGVGDIIQTFCGTFVTGVMSCSLLYFFDRSELMNKLVSKLNNLHTISTEVNYFYRQAEYFERYAADLMSIDIKKFKEETELYYSFALEIENTTSEAELNIKLKNISNKIGVKIPWEGDFDSFMSNKNAVLVFE
ncbi:hypothetical protein ANS017_03020 [Paraclostridium bifermentans]|uniref:hypothetical protein n=1 Tax=Paraclostridium bifermentans TaxID=1490 RepID=UPI0021C42746|nr:hypothetical protein [Paraclostridium bifermentans]GKZ02437.1 hypothetical protein ANS014_08710 [Paraclostridium bifermentans]GKZ07190.1 hypothetical protein ANS015_20730 [Paraclostridium bifermentans]GKZ08918.1 hypothetical protein ANS017_03020 [Paraclostridium bifermentans]